MGLSAPLDTVILLLQSSRYNPGQLRAWAASPSSSISLTGCIITHRPSRDAEPCRIQGLAQPPPSAGPAPTPGPLPCPDRPARSSDVATAPQLSPPRLPRPAAGGAPRVSRPLPPNRGPGRGGGASVAGAGAGIASAAVVILIAVIILAAVIAMVSGDSGPGGSGGGSAGQSP